MTECLELYERWERTRREREARLAREAEDEKTRERAEVRRRAAALWMNRLDMTPRWPSENRLAELLGPVAALQEHGSLKEKEPGTVNRLPAWSRAAAPVSLLLLAIVSACFLFQGTPIKTDRISLSADPQMNGRSPVLVDLVLVKDRQLLEGLLALSPADWFALRDQLRLDHPGALEVCQTCRWELIPGKDTVFPNPFRTKRGVALLLYADYSSSGTPQRVRIEQVKYPRVRLGARNVEVIPLP